MNDGVRALTILGGMVGLYMTVQQLRGLQRAQRTGTSEEVRLLRKIDEKLGRMAATTEER